MRNALRDMQTVVVAFSGGTDSSLVLKIAHDELGAGAVAVTAVSATFPTSELDSSRRIASEIGARHCIIETDQLRIPDFVRNDANRCYHCKTDLYSALGKIRKEYSEGYIVDGTNVDDLGDDRPGLQAAREWGVRSPLLDALLSKAEVRELARRLRLSNWDKPAAACLSSRVPRGIAITKKTLSRIERAEAILAAEGFREVRVRDHGDIARIEVGRKEISALLDEGRRNRISEALRQAGYRFVTVDLEGYRQGGVSLTDNDTV
ncbi:MAG: ATP-dependent sacrificial sulfur transferase LarE [Nitrospiraceae bacterium]